MKTKLLITGFLFIAGVAMISCTTRERYLDLSTGEMIQLEKDQQTGLLVNKLTGEPVYIYVDTKTNDTIYGETGEVINGHIVKRGDKYYFDGDEKLEVGDNGEMKYKNGDHKVKVEKDGDMKIKNDDRKIKIDGETGERKVKND